MWSRFRMLEKKSTVAGVVGGSGWGLEAKVYGYVLGILCT
jgi:ABC-type methionine transport system permease subunit